MRILVIGAAGRTGRLVVEQALGHGHDVRAFTHTTLPSPAAEYSTRLPSSQPRMGREKELSFGRSPGLDDQTPSGFGSRQNDVRARRSRTSQVYRKKTPPAARDSRSESPEAIDGAGKPTCSGAKAFSYQQTPR